MAEAFARAYGSDVLWVQSAGLSPAASVALLTKQMLEERSLKFDDQFPKPLDLLQREKFDLVVNMSGHPFNFPSTARVDWKVKDPIGESVETYRAVAKQIEDLVMRLILDERNSRR
jgi:protein-tyrosine-phosphatase